MTLPELYELGLFIHVCTILSETDSEPKDYTVGKSIILEDFTKLILLDSSWDSSFFIVNINNDTHIHWNNGLMPYIRSNENKVLWLQICKKITMSKIDIAKLVMEKQ